MLTQVPLPRGSVFYCHDTSVAVLVNILLFPSAYFLVVVGLDSRSKQSADDGFVTVSLKPDKGMDSAVHMFAFSLVGPWFFGPGNTYVLAFGFQGRGQILKKTVTT